ncbi:hypothetical protein FQZ97_788950 [compost metagenome]
MFLRTAGREIHHAARAELDQRAFDLFQAVEQHRLAQRQVFARCLVVQRHLLDAVDLQPFVGLPQQQALVEGGAHGEVQAVVAVEGGGGLRLDEGVLVAVRDQRRNAGGPEAGFGRCEAVAKALRRQQRGGQRDVHLPHLHRVADAQRLEFLGHEGEALLAVLVDAGLQVGRGQQQVGPQVEVELERGEAGDLWRTGEVEQSAEVGRRLLRQFQWRLARLVALGCARHVGHETQAGRLDVGHHLRLRTRGIGLASDGFTLFGVVHRAGLWRRADHLEQADVRRHGEDQAFVGPAGIDQALAVGLLALDAARDQVEAEEIDIHGLLEHRGQAGLCRAAVAEVHQHQGLSRCHTGALPDVGEHALAKGGRLLEHQFQGVVAQHQAGEGVGWLVRSGGLVQQRLGLCRRQQQLFGHGRHGAL